MSVSEVREGTSTTPAPARKELADSMKTAMKLLFKRNYIRSSSICWRATLTRTSNEKPFDIAEQQHLGVRTRNLFSYHIQLQED